MTTFFFQKTVKILKTVQNEYEGGYELVGTDEWTGGRWAAGEKDGGGEDEGLRDGGSEGV